jgi:glycosyltransferase involved in cell wall biosynthesis
MTSTTAFELDPVPERGSTVICIPVLAADERTLATVRSVVEHSDSAIPILLVGRVASIEKTVEGLPTELHLDRRPTRLVAQDGGETDAVNQAMRVSQPADIALVVPGCVVTAEWLESLREAATSDSVVASATALSIGGCGVELFGPEPNDSGGLPTYSGPKEAMSAAELSRSGETVEQTARQVRGSSLRLRPRIARMGPGCVYIRRASWELAGPLDGDLGLDVALEAMARRTMGLGLIHVAADDVLVFGLPGEQVPQGEQASAHDELSSVGERDALQAVDDPAHGTGEQQVQETLADDESLPIRRSLNSARAALGGLSVTIDGRSLTASVGGTQTYVIELILALAREPELTVRVLIAPDISARATDALATAPGIELLTYEEAIRNATLTDVVHRPQQVFTPDDLALLRLVGRRIVVGQQDLIAYHNDTYHPSVEAWRAYRRTTRLALAEADQVVFFSDHARRDVLAEDLLSEQRAQVVGIGADTLEPQGPMSDPPGGVVAGEPFLLCLGADYAHKNRPFAIELLGALRELGWEGRLVLCGARVAHGSSRERETEILARDPKLARFVVDLGPVDEPGKRWLYAHACALLYPTLYEGFGLIPLEAARAGLPCLFAAQASLREVAPDAATLIPWDAHASARAVLTLLSEGGAREEHLARLRSHSVPGWGEVAGALRAVYEQALRAPPSAAKPRVWQELDREEYIVKLDEDIAKLKLTAQEYQDAYHSLNARVASGLPLIDEGGLLSKAQQRGLMRIAGRGRLGAVLLAPLGPLGRHGASESSSDNIADP